MGVKFVNFCRFLRSLEKIGPQAPRPPSWEKPPLVGGTSPNWGALGPNLFKASSKKSAKIHEFYPL